MKEYTYLRRNIRQGPIAVSVDHREEINNKAENGWKYVGFIPTYISEAGQLQEIDLVFERDIEAKENV